MSLTDRLGAESRAGADPRRWHWPPAAASAPRLCPLPQKRAERPLPPRPAGPPPPPPPPLLRRAPHPRPPRGGAALRAGRPRRRRLHRRRPAVRRADRTARLALGLPDQFALRGGRAAPGAPPGARAGTGTRRPPRRARRGAGHDWRDRHRVRPAGHRTVAVDPTAGAVAPARRPRGPGRLLP